MKKSASGKLITFEGPEKSGKSTQAKILSEYLESKGYETLFIREPGSTEIGEKIRSILLDKRHNKMSLMTEMLLYMAARAQLIEEVIRPALKRGTIVLCDRFMDSTLAYQGFGCGMDIDIIKKVGRYATGGIRPDLTLLLDFNESVTHLKNHKSPDRIEIRPDAFHWRVKKGYFALAKKEPRRIHVVRVHRDLQKTQRKIRKIVDQWLLKKLSASQALSHY